MNPDTQYMRHAIRVARRAWGHTSPNPAVGCVLVKEGRILAAVATAPGGRPHAEALALADAGGQTKGATAYVTLEPCAHHGKTPPCADALIQAGIARVVIACRDEDTRVRGTGIKKLRDAGIEVTEGICEQEALPLYAGFFSRIHHGLPEINLKIATSADGKICYSDGTSQWITGEQARAHGHLLRAEHEAILTGIGTVLADNPSLTCRLPGMETHSPLRVVMDSSLRTPHDAALLKDTAIASTLIFTLESTPEKHRPYLNAGAEVAVLEEMTLEHAARALTERGISRLLVEAGQGIASHTLMSRLLARLYWFRAPIIIGEDGFAAFTGEALEHLAKGRRLLPESSMPLGRDRLDVYVCTEERA